MSALDEVRDLLDRARQAGAKGVSFEMRFLESRGTTLRFRGSVDNQIKEAITILDAIQVEKAAFDSLGAATLGVGRQWLETIASTGCGGPEHRGCVNCIPGADEVRRG